MDKLIHMKAIGFSTIHDVSSDDENRLIQGLNDLDQNKYSEIPSYSLISSYGNSKKESSKEREKSIDADTPRSNNPTDNFSFHPSNSATINNDKESNTWSDMIILRSALPRKQIDGKGPHVITFSDGFRVKAASRKNIVMDTLYSTRTSSNTSSNAINEPLCPMFQV
jgi:hypothetical protein